MATQPPPEAALPAVGQRVSLVVDAATWLPDQPPLDIAGDLRKILRAAGIDATGAEAGDGVVRVTYRESKGEEYVDLFNHPAGSGTRITLELTTTSANSARHSLSLESNTGAGATGDLREAALTNLKSRAAYEHLGDFVSASLGNREALAKLEPVLYDEMAQRQIADFFEAMSHVPEAKGDQAQLFVVRRRFEACVPLGRDAVPALLGALERGMVPEFETRIAAALGKIGDPLPARKLLDKAKERAEFGFADAEFAVVLLNAVGATGDASLIPELEQLAGSDEPRVAAAARAAEEAIAGRR